MKQLDLQYDPPVTVDVNGMLDPEGQISYIGKAHRQLDGKWRCLANVGGALCLVEVRIEVG